MSIGKTPGQRPRIAYVHHQTAYQESTRSSEERGCYRIYYFIKQVQRHQSHRNLKLADHFQSCNACDQKRARSSKKGNLIVPKRDSKPLNTPNFTGWLRGYHFSITDAAWPSNEVTAQQAV
ncbi:hypothetical protein FKW77_008163 [Venturia effusa]|uniref:Uncharacterized protein n=1 Tax=Venturia effusa TaxID=50376 RepID=A0A517LLW6_9PEZI|nr:hypothetical protein FKW77_008163 [Venturia effusa]